MLKIKEKVTGFIYDREYDTVEKIFTNEYTEAEWSLINKGIIGECVLITKFDNINELFDYSSVEELNKYTDLDVVLDFV